MACVGEAIGLSLPNSNMMPAPYESRADIAIAAGEQVTQPVFDEDAVGRRRRVRKQGRKGQQTEFTIVGHGNFPPSNSLQ